jgi:hypothetical protein
MQPIQNTNDRLVLKGASPLFRPFFFGGLGLLVVGAGLLIGGPLFGRFSGGSPLGADDPMAVPGLGLFLTVFGFFVTIAPLIGRFPFRKEVIIDRAAGTLIRRDQTLLRFRQETYPFAEVRRIHVEESRHVDGDPYFTLQLWLESGESVTLDRFSDRPAADLAARLIRDHLSRAPAASGPAAR